MTALRPTARRILPLLVYGLAVVAPLVLLLNLRITFLRDWPIHVWIIDHYGQYFRAHGTLPTVVNVAPATGIALPVFYAWLLHPVLGVGAAALGAEVALRLAILALVAIQFFALLAAGRKIFGSSPLAFTVAGSVIWSTYALTNLYNRGAIAEYFATGFFVTAIACGASAAVAPVRSARWFHGWLTGFFLLLAAAAHPTTALLAAVFLVLLGAALAAGWTWSRPKLSLSEGLGLAGAASVGLLVLAPWIYANAWFGTKLSIVQDALFRFRPDHCDTFWGRFTPFPYDAASTLKGIDTDGAPYLEAPVNVVLLGLLAWNLELCRRQLARTGSSTVPAGSSPAREILMVAIGWFLFLAVFSLSPSLAANFQFFEPYIQYVYRLVSHCNAALLVAVFASGVLVARSGGYRRFRNQTNVVMAAGLTVAVLGLGIKLQHADAVAIDADTPLSLEAAQAELGRAYHVPSLVRELSPDEVRTAVELPFPVDVAGPHFGEAVPATINLGNPGWVVTNAVAFPWMKLEIAGEELRGSQLARVECFLAVYLPAGRHEIHPVWRPDPVWLLLHRLSQAGLALVLVFSAGWVVYFNLPSVRAADHTP